MQKRNNQVWRRRQCTRCKAIFTTHEQYDLANSLRVKESAHKLTPFLRERLFLSIYQSSKHRKNALTDAAEMTDLIIPKIILATHDGLVAKTHIVEATQAVLAHFDQTASSVYAAYHPAKRYASDDTKAS